MSQDEGLEDLLTLLSDYKDFNPTAITRTAVPSSVEFAKHVSKGTPRIYKIFSRHRQTDGDIKLSTDPSLVPCPAYFWSEPNDLTRLVNDRVEVAATPTGRADDIHQIDGHDEDVFLAPATLSMTLVDLLSKLNESPQTPVYYLQSQNSNLTSTPLKPILSQVPETFPFAEPVLGSPEAINIWVGDERSVTSTHRDPYENLYLVLKGTKVFTLYPPVDEVVLPTKQVRTGRYEYDDTEGRFSSVLDGEDRIPWVAVDPIQSQDALEQLHPLYVHASPRQVVVEEGEMLYLPSGWYHHVQQRCGKWDREGTRAPCIAVNYWYDMDYDGEKYVMRQFLGRIAAKIRGRSVQ